MFDKMKTITRSDYIKQLKSLARQALNNYDLKVIGITFISQQENTVFKVVAEHYGISKTSGNNILKYGVYLLRICRQNRYDPITIQSELSWLSFLSKNSNLEISEPISNRDRSFLTIATEPETFEQKYCVLFKWLSGRFIQTGLTNRTVKQVGAFLGQLHNYSQQFKPPKAFNRPKWNEDGLFGSPIIELPSDNDLFSQSVKKILQSATSEIRSSLATLKQNTETFGLIHNDLHLGNCVFDRDKIKVFDFDDCGWGYYLYDLTTYLYYLDREENFASLQASLFEGYLSKRSLPEQYEFYLEAMIAARRLYLMRYFLLRKDDPQFKKTIPKFINHTIEQMNQFLQRLA